MDSNHVPLFAEGLNTQTRPRPGDFNLEVNQGRLVVAKGACNV